MRCFPNVRQADKNKKPIYNDIVKGCKVLLRIRDENASEEGKAKAKELHLVSNISVAEVEVDKPRRNVDFDGWLEYSDFFVQYYLLI